MSFVAKLIPFNIRRDFCRQLKGALSRFVQPGNLVCDIGCGARPFAELLSQIGSSHVGIDTIEGFYGTARVDVVATADAVSIRDNIADAVLSSQVIEHLPDPEAALAEFGRILKKSGLLFISFPFIYPLHVAPHHYFRYSRHGFPAMCERHGFEVVEEHLLGGFWYMASIHCDVYFGSLERSAIRGLPPLTTLSLPFQWLFWILHKFEGLVYRLAGKDVKYQRRSWTVNLVYVARKTATNRE